jgi:type I restriction enzyme, S subunit
MPAQEIHLSPQQRRATLQVLDRNRLSQLTEQLVLEVEDRGATVDRILLTDFPSYPVLCPPPELVQRFDDFAGAIWSRIHANMAENQTLSKLRDTLLPKLLSGEIRIKDAEEQAGAAL